MAGLAAAHSASTSSASARRVISSKAAKGSSSSSSLGLVTRARASATRIAMPPESWAGRAASAPFRPTRASAASARVRASPRAVPANSSGSAALARAVRQGASVGAWNTTAVSPRPGVRATSPRLGASKPASSRMAVDLPQPDGPTRATISPAASARPNGPSARPRG